MYNAVIIDTETGGKRIIQIDFEWNESSEFWWTDGSFGCDCNRGKLFYGSEYDSPCGISRFFVERVVLDDGREILIDGSIPQVL